jgi:hypothetical protein
MLMEEIKMSSKSRFSMIVGLSLGLMISFPTLAKQELPEITVDGLHLMEDSKLAVVYAKPDVDLGVYNRVMLLDAGVAFKKNWKRDQNRSYPNKVNSRDMDRIKERLANLFHEVFTEKLVEAGYELVSETADDVLIVRPAIINLDVEAPDVASANRSYTLTQSAGEMTLYLELYDSLTGDLLGKALDRQADRESAYLTWQTRSSNRVAAESMLKSWADVLVNALNDAHKATGKSAED